MSDPFDWKPSTLLEHLEYRIWWPLERWLDGIRGIPRRLRWFYQRGRKGYAEEDLWCIGAYVLEVMERALAEFRDHRERRSVPDIYINPSTDRDAEIALAETRFKDDLTYIIDRLRIHREIVWEHEYEKHARDWREATQVADKALREALDKFRELADTLWD